MDCVRIPLGSTSSAPGMWSAICVFKSFTANSMALPILSWIFLAKLLKILSNPFLYIFDSSSLITPCREYPPLHPLLHISVLLLAFFAFLF